MALKFLNDGYFAGKVGIGTESPSYQLTLGGNAVGSTEGLRINDPSNAAYGAHFSFSDTPNEVWIGGITNNTYNSAIGIHRDSTRAITIDVNSNVGIGTESPLRKLDLIADLSTDAVRIKNTNINGGGLSVFAANGGGGTNRILTLGDSSENIKVAVIENGNVGIGETNPTQKLDVSGNVNILGTLFVEAANNNIRLLDTNDSTVNFSVGVNGIFQIRDVAAATTPFSIQKTAPGNSMIIKADGEITLGEYGTGTLVSDASGNITVSSGGGEGGPYLPLAGGTMTTGAVVTFLDSSGSTDNRLKLGTGGDMQLFHDGSNSYIKDTGTGDLILNVNNFRLKNAADSEIYLFAQDGGGVNLYHTGNAIKLQTTSTGVSVTGTNTNIAFTFGNTVPNNPLHTNWYGGFTGVGMSSSTAGIRLAGDGGANDLCDIGYYTSSTVSHANWNSALYVQKTSATFAGNAGVGGVLPLSNGGANATLLGVHNSGVGNWAVTKYTNGSTGTAAGDGAVMGMIGINAYMFNYEAGNLQLGTSGATRLTIASTGATTFTGTVTAPTFLGDLNGTINTVTTAVTKANATNDTTVATTAFVQNLIGTIPAGLVFQGTWNAATNTPTLTSGTGTTGNFYIVSVDGSTNLDGITDWKVGDWAVFVEQGASDQWEKVDNSSVLDGSGTGQTVPLWAGSGTSNTLDDSILTQSGGSIITQTATSVAQYSLDSIAANDSVVNFKQAGVQKAKIGYDHSEDALAFIHGSGAFSTAGMVLDGTGVGIGTTSPGYKLDVTGDARFGDGNNFNPLIQYAGSGRVAASPGYSFVGDLDTGMFNPNLGNTLAFTTAGSERMRISSAGAIKFNAYDSTNNTGTPTYLLGTDASGNVVKTLTTPSPITSQAASLYDLIPNGAFTTTYAFTSTAGVYAEVMESNDVITATGTYSVQVFVSDYAVGGTQYNEYYSGVMSWYAANTNDNGGGAISEISLHRAGHAANQGVIYLRTRETTSPDNVLKLEVMCNKTYTGASNLVFKFVRLI